MRVSTDVCLDAVLLASVSLLVGVCAELCCCTVGLSHGHGGLLQLFTVAGVVLGTAVLVKSQVKVSLAGKAVAVTGCDSGFGFAIANQLHQLGCTVFAGCLLKESHGEGATLLEQMTSPRIHVIQLDVTSNEQVKAYTTYIQQHLSKAGSSGLWGLVNNAGVGGYGAVEWMSLPMYQKTFDVNVWGLVRMTQALLPLIRRSTGRVVNMASPSGRFVLPNISSYCMSKYSVEAFSDALRYEMMPFGVKVGIIEPGNYMKGTNIFAPEMLRRQTNQMWESMTEELRRTYTKDVVDYSLKAMEGAVQSGDVDLSPVVDAVEDALSQSFPRCRYLPMGWEFRKRIFVATHLPEFVYTYLYVG